MCLSAGRQPHLMLESLFTLESLMESVRTGLRRIVQDLLRSCPREEAVILVWPLVCGKEVAARSQAVSFNEGLLLVEVPDSVWRKQLQSFAERYVSGYEGLLGPVVESVQFRIRRSALGTQHSAGQENR
jgi:Dna[CI] antecedent DciA-like protein